MLMELRPRQVKVEVYEVVPDRVVGPDDHSMGRQLRVLREQFGAEWVLRDRELGREHRIPLERWQGSDPDTFLAYRFRYSPLPRWLRPLR